VALAWIDPETGIKCKIRIDWWHGTRLLADVKSALDVTRDGFSRACARLNYALSAAMYCEGVFQATSHFSTFPRGCAWGAASTGANRVA
jgi:PDDEXK-like domain of unknown function (DUF3799)